MFPSSYFLLHFFQVNFSPQWVFVGGDDHWWWVVGRFPFLFSLYIFSLGWVVFGGGGWLVAPTALLIFPT